MASNGRYRDSDAEYFNLSDKDTRIATARRQQKTPTLEQIKYVINKMPSFTEIDHRNRALLALTLLTGARDRAIASLKLKHVDLTAGCVNQDAREVKTKFSKTFATFFFPVGEEFRAIVSEWVSYLRDEKLWGNDDPLFPATRVALAFPPKSQLSNVKTQHRFLYVQLSHQVSKRCDPFVCLIESGQSSVKASGPGRVSRLGL